MAFEVPPLPYGYDALEPHIDETMQIHHDKHHAAYVNNLNNALENYPDLQSKSVEDLIANLNSVPEAIRTAVRNNGGGHVNHTMFWQIMGRNGGGEPTGRDRRGDQVAHSAASTTLKTAFNEAGAKRFGSGWAWLVRADRAEARGRQHRQPGQPGHGRQVSRSWASTCGSTRTTSSIRTAARITSRRGGT